MQCKQISKLDKTTNAWKTAPQLHSCFTWRRMLSISPESWNLPGIQFHQSPNGWLNGASPNGFDDGALKSHLYRPRLLCCVFWHLEVSNMGVSTGQFLVFFQRCPICLTWDVEEIFLRGGQNKVQHTSIIHLAESKGIGFFCGYVTASLGAVNLSAGFSVLL